MKGLDTVGGGKGTYSSREATDLGATKEKGNSLKLSNFLDNKTRRAMARRSQIVVGSQRVIGWDCFPKLTCL